MILNKAENLNIEVTRDLIKSRIGFLHRIADRIEKEKPVNQLHDCESYGNLLIAITHLDNASKQLNELVDQ